MERLAESSGTGCSLVPPASANTRSENVKLAWVVIDEAHMVGLDRVNKAYQLRDDVPTWIRPLQGIRYDSFERWCTTLYDRTWIYK
jgi:hypothetical protein